MTQRSPWLDSDCNFEQLSSHPASTAGFSPSFILPFLFLSGDSVSPTTLIKQHVRLIIDARVESPLRQHAKELVPDVSSDVQFLDVDYRQGYNHPCLSPLKVRVLSSADEAFATLQALSTDIDKLEGPRFVVLSIPAHDHDRFELLRYFPVVTAFLDFALCNIGVGVLVHCAAGVSRSPSLIAAFLCQRFRLRSESVTSFLRRRRPMVFPNAGFATQLKLWCEQFVTPSPLLPQQEHWEDFMLQPEKSQREPQDQISKT